MSPGYVTGTFPCNMSFHSQQAFISDDLKMVPERTRYYKCKVAEKKHSTVLDHFSYLHNVLTCFDPGENYKNRLFV
jgi:hypothetical protein